MRINLFPPAPLNSLSLSPENGSLPLDPYDPPNQFEHTPVSTLAEGSCYRGPKFSDNQMSSRKFFNQVQIMQKLFTLKKGVCKWKHHAKMNIKQNIPMKVDSKQMKD